MELFSHQFRDLVKLLFEATNTRIIATIPMSKGKPIPFVEYIRGHKRSQVYKVRSNYDIESVKTIIAIPLSDSLFQVTRDNREQLFTELKDVLST